MLNEYDKILVTGGLGFIGRHLVHALVALGKEVALLDNASSTMAAPTPPDVRLVTADIRDAQQLAQATTGAELVFHVAANANGTLSVLDPRFDFETNALGTFNLVHALALSGAKRLVYISSASVYGIPRYFPMDEEHPTRPFINYGASKLSGELFCLAFHHSHGLPVVIGRPFCVYGPGENPQEALVEVSRYVRWHLNDQPIQVIGDPDRKTRDFVHVSDLVAGLLLIADRAEDGEVFNIGSGEETSMRQLVETIGMATKREPKIKKIASITDDTYRLVAGISKLRSLGYSPAKSLLDGVQELALQLGDRPELPGGATIFRRGQQQRAER